VGSYDAFALGLGVSIEGILNDEFSTIGQPSQALLDDLERAQDLIRKSSLPQQVKNRIAGSISSMAQSRPGDKFPALIASKQVVKKHVDAWKKIRNKSAHADVSNSIPLQQFIDLCQMNVVLFYHLIFSAIGYKGPYRDYGTPGWPLKDYPPV
jgi:hypothetical protein